MDLEKIGRNSLLGAVVCLGLGVVRFLASADPRFGAEWACFFSRGWECSVVMPTYSPILAQVGVAGLLVGAALCAYARDSRGPKD